MTDSWSLCVDVPDHDIVRRKGKLVRRALGIPALHNLRGPWNQHHVVKIHWQLLDAAIVPSGEVRARLYGRPFRWHPDLGTKLAKGERFDVLIIRRAPRPLDASIRLGDWRTGGRLLYGDNAESATKAARDWMARRVFGLGSDSSPLLRWHTGQERSGQPKLYQLEVRIYPAEDCQCCGLPRAPGRWLRGEL